MDHQSGQGFNSDDSDLDMQAEISEKHKKVDEFSKNLELCGSEDEMFVEIEQPLANLALNTGSFKSGFFVIGIGEFL